MNINTIAQLADNLQKSAYSKKAIYPIFREALENDGQFGDTGMAALYAYFTPTLPAKPKTDEQWIAKAMADKHDVRYYLQYIYSDGSRIMATDGHRLHIVKKSIDTGFYDKNMIKIDVDAKFPDVDRVIPSDNQKLIKFSELSISDYYNSDRNATQPVYQFDNMCIDAKYLKQACLYFDNPVIQYKDKSSSVLISDDDKLAVVMPMRI